MTRQVVSRSQRRMEKKQALVLLVLVLAVSLVSFTLGVMVGRGASGSEVAAAPASSSPRIPVAGTVSEKQPPASGSEKSAEKLTFYDSLPKGEPSPLGSGINLDPEEKKPAERKAVEPKPKAAAAEPEKVVAAPVPAQKPPAASADGAYVVQVASFRGADDAAKLSGRLSDKSYASFVETADLKEKGVWHRVFVGPFKTSAAAEKIVARLQAEEKLSALVRKR